MLSLNKHIDTIIKFTSHAYKMRSYGRRAAYHKKKIKKEKKEKDFVGTYYWYD